MENFKKEKFNFYVSKELKNKIEKEASDMSMTQSSFVVLAVNEYIKYKDFFPLLIKLLK